MEYYNQYEEDAQEQIRMQRRRAQSLQARKRRRFKRRMRWLFTRIVPFCLVCLLLLTGIGFGIRGLFILVRDRVNAQETEMVADAESLAEKEGEPAETTIVADAATEQEEAPEADAAETMDAVPGDGADAASSEEEESTEKITGQNSVIAFTDEETVGGNDADLATNGSLYAEKTEYTGTFGADVLAEKGILIDPKTHTIIADKGGKTRIIPASMTKVLTLLVAAENIKDLNDTVTITPEIGDYAHKHDLSIVGFNTDEVVTVKDLLYGTILPSGGDAAMALATYVGGSHEGFVDMMNAKVAQLGLAETTHFTNCVGLYDEDHYSTCYDIAMIMQAALNNELCRQILTEHKYTTVPTAQHPAGIEISHWFLRRIEDKDCGADVLFAKTGYVKESGYCAVSYAQNDDGQPYICVTVNSGSSWKCIYDHVRIYSAYFKPAG